MKLAALSLVIPTYNRQDYALRAMHYWSRLPVKVHVWDGSAQPLPASSLSSFGDNVRYHHRPVGFYQRLKEAVAEIDTPFCILAGDDEFYLPSGLERAIDELERDKELIACAGQAVGFWRQTGQLRCRRLYPELAGRRLVGGDRFTRMHDHMTRYTPSTIYAVARTSAWKQVMTLMLEREFPVYALGELQFEIAMAFLGKSRNLDMLFWLRSLENEGTRGTDISLEPERTFEGWWRNECNAGEVDALLEIMARGLVSETTDKLQLAGEIRRSFEAYLVWLKGYSYRPLHRRVVSALLRRLKAMASRLDSRFDGVLLANAPSVLGFEIDSRAAGELKALVNYIDEWYLRTMPAATPRTMLEK